MTFEETLVDRLDGIGDALRDVVEEIRDTRRQILAIDSPVVRAAFEHAAGVSLAEPTRISVTRPYVAEPKLAEACVEIERARIIAERYAVEEAVALLDSALAKLRGEE